jgi:catechol 2,3-dioxygenase-like lactoylglutathione lyase family enzyme
LPGQKNNEDPSMLHHVSVGVSDVARATGFYDSVLAALGYKRVMEVLPYGVAYGTDKPEFWVGLPENRAPAAVGNGVHIGFKARSKAAVQAFHRAALAAGGTDEGAAGPRPNYGPDYYGAFVRDLDGNKLEACLTPEPVAPPKAIGRRNSGAKARVAKKGKARRKKSKTAAKKARRRRK